LSNLKPGNSRALNAGVRKTLIIIKKMPTPLPREALLYELPDARIARYPLAQRDQSRLLVYRPGAQPVIQDHHFYELPELLPPDALLLLNDTRVLPARLEFRTQTGARIEVFCLEPADGTPPDAAWQQTHSGQWHCIVGNRKRWKPQQTLLLEAQTAEGQPLSLWAELLPEAIPETHHAGPTATGALNTHRVQLRWSPATLPFAEVLAQAGQMPLPPYLGRPAEAQDRETYQTVWAAVDGAVAAPTASLHFTPEVLKALEAKGIETAQVTLHVGAGTFLPVKANDVRQHPMHAEAFSVPVQTLAALRDALAAGRPMIPVGTTALRTLESLYWLGVQLGAETEVGPDTGMRFIPQWPAVPPGQAAPSPAHALQTALAVAGAQHWQAVGGQTQLMVTPGFPWHYTSALITNFHQPGSTLLALIAGLVGDDWHLIYSHALANDYRFLSYGDSSLLWRQR
jgi:S-adenosylmethionine:tRNA ribosyltransferase-isomerase